MTVGRRSGGPLAGIRIVEFAGIGPGPYAAMLLADMGAEIIRIDRLGGGDPYSRFVVSRGRSVAEADLKHPPDRDRVLSLLDEADALIEGFRPGVMERLGLGPDDLLARNPRLVYGRMTGWGQDGPLARTAGHDIGYIAVTGALDAIGLPDAPVPPLNLVGDYGGGSLFLVSGILAALLSAGRTGEGQVVDAAICDGAASLMAMFCDMRAQGAWTDRRGANLLDGGAPFYRTFACKDGRHLAVGALEPQFYAELCRLIGLTPAPARDDRAAWPALHAQFATIFAQRTRDEWATMLQGMDCCAAPVLSLSEAPEHEHLAARETFVVRDGVSQPGPAPRFSRTPSVAGSVPTQRQQLADARWIPRGDGWLTKKIGS